MSPWNISSISSQRTDGLMSVHLEGTGLDDCWCGQLCLRRCRGLFTDQTVVWQACGHKSCVNVTCSIKCFEWSWRSSINASPFALTYCTSIQFNNLMEIFVFTHHLRHKVKKLARDFIYNSGLLFKWTSVSVVQVLNSWSLLLSLPHAVILVSFPSLKKQIFLFLF